MRIFICIMVLVSWVFIFSLGIQVGKAQIVKEAFEKLPKDLSIEKNKAEFYEYMKHWKAGEK